MRITLAILLVPSLCATPLAGQPPTGAWEGVDRSEQRRHTVFAGSGMLAGAFLVTAVCDGPEGQKDIGLCGRSLSGSAFNGVLLGALGGHFTHLLTVEPSGSRRSRSAAAPAVLFSARTDPCPPEPEPCHRSSQPSKAKYMILSVGGGALLGGAITAIVCQEIEHERRRRGEAKERPACSETYAYTVFTGAAIGAFVGAGVGGLLYYIFEGNVDYAPPPSVDLVTFRIPIG